MAIISNSTQYCVEMDYTFESNIKLLTRALRVHATSEEAAIRSANKLLANKYMHSIGHNDYARGSITIVASRIMSNSH